MSIKKKLIFMLTVMGLMLFLIAGYLLWNVVQVSSHLDRIGSGIDYLHDLGSVRVNAYKQAHLLVHFFYYSEERAIQDVFSIDDEIQGQISQLYDEAQGGRHGMAPGSARSEADQRAIEHVLSIKRGYRTIMEDIQRAVDLKKNGNTAAAIKIITSQVEQQTEEVFLRGVEDAINDKRNELMATYDHVLMHLGALPWTGGTVLQKLQGTRYSIQYYLAVDRLSLALHREVNEIIQYIVTGHSLNVDEYRESGADFERALQETVTIIHAQDALGMEGEKEQEVEVDDLRREYQKLSTLMERAHELKRSGRGQEAFQLAEIGIARIADHQVLPKLERLTVNSRAEIILDHRTLVRFVYLVGSMSIVIILIVAGILLVVVYRLIMRMLQAIHALDIGTEIIGRGDLDHRIVVETNDELSDLAGSFNKMTASLKDSNEDLRSFIFSLSHDLRTPLVNIKGFSEELITGIRELDPILERYLDGFPEEEQRKYRDVLKKDIPDALKFIGSSSNQMDRLITAVLALSRIGHRELKPEPIDMDLLVRSILESFAHRIGHGKVSVTVQELPPIVADHLAMEQCVNNLLDNAIKYLDPARPGIIEVSAERGNEETIFCVRDNGRGIAKDDLEKIFGLFRRAGQQDVPGEGIGLAYVKALVKRQGGRIWCESALGSGTTFWFSVPDHAPAAQQPGSLRYTV